MAGQILHSLIDHTNLAGAEDLVVSGNYAYCIGRGSGKLAVVDVSNPFAMFVAAIFTDTDLTEGMAIAKNGSTLYVCSWHNHKLLILDATNPLAITKTGSISLGTTDGSANVGAPDELRKVFYLGGYCYCCHLHDGTLFIVDVSTPASPSIAGSCTGIVGAFASFVKGNYAYVLSAYNPADGSASPMKVVDVSNKATPTVVKTSTSATGGGFANIGNNLFMTDYGASKIYTFDITDPPNTTQSAVLTDTNLGGPNRISLSGNIGFCPGETGNLVASVDFTNPTSLVTGPILTDATNLAKCYSTAVGNGVIFALGRNADSICSIWNFVSPQLSQTMGRFKKR